MTAPPPLPEFIDDRIAKAIATVRTFRSWNAVELYNAVLEAAGLSPCPLPIAVKDAIARILMIPDWSTDQMYHAIRQAHALPHETEKPPEVQIGAPPGQGRIL